jgi:hypothetical protein
MKHVKLISLFAVILFALSCVLFLNFSKADVVKSKYFNYVEKGAKVIKTSPSTQYKLMETYPQAVVTVYNVGTTNLATIWADRDGVVIKANPFIADTDSFYYFYVDCGKYDIKFSGTGIAVPYTYGDVFICGNTSSSGGTVTGSGTENFITKWVTDTELGDSVLFNPSNVQAGSSTLIGWTASGPTASLDIALGRNGINRLEINNGTLGSLADLRLHRIEPIPTITIPGLNFGTIATDPTLPVAGDCWYNTTSNTFKCFNGTTNFFLGPLNFVDSTFIDFTQTNNSVTATLTDAIKIVSYTLFFSASGDILDTTDGPLVIIPDFAGEIVGWTVYEKGNVSGSVSFSVDKVTPTYPVTVAPSFSTMVGVGNKPALILQIANRANVSNWTTTTFAQGDIIRISVDVAPTNVVNVFVEFKVRRTGL